MRNITKIFLFAMIVFIALPIQAYDFEVDGIYYNITSPSNLEVGVTNKYDFTDRIRNNNETYSGEVIIPEFVNYNNRTYTVTSIGAYAFGGDSYPTYSGWGGIETIEYLGTQITKVNLPQSIVEIGINAFCNCQKLTEIKLPNSIKKIGAYAFMLTPLTYIVLGDQLEYINNQAFNSCTALSEVFYTSIEKPEEGNDVYYNCSPYLIKYVPSALLYGFGLDYVSFNNNLFEYSGGIHNVTWTNNIKYLQCDISPIQTKINAGEYTDIITADYSGDINLSVNILYTYTITQAPLSVVVNDYEREYGELNPDFTCVVSGFVPGESLSNLGSSPVLQCEANKQSDAGNYTIYADLNAPNYNITYKYGTLKVLKAPITVSIKNSVRLYGNENPSFELSYTGLKNNENNPSWTTLPSFNTEATIQSNVGDYVVIVSGGESKNYLVSQYNQGLLTIIKRDLVAKANDAVRLYGEENPEFVISYNGFVNNDNIKSLQELPKLTCNASINSNVGEYPIIVSGGMATNYNFIYEDGVLTINPLSLGWEKEYNTVTYDDMTISTNQSYFNYVPSLIGNGSENDFIIEIWACDKNSHDINENNVIEISNGDFSGTYIPCNLDSPMWAGRYMFQLKYKHINPNVDITLERAFLLINPTSTQLKWDSPSVIEIEEGQTIDLGISYKADKWCDFILDYDSELISISSENPQSENPIWEVTGLKEGETILSFSIECLKNDYGFYNFKDSEIVTRVIKVVSEAGIEDIFEDTSSITVYSLDGLLIKKDCYLEELKSLTKGIYIIVSGKERYKISI